VETTEICDGNDNDCDGDTDEADATGCTTYYKDEDRDTYGSAESACLCVAAEPFDATNHLDCCDTDDKAKPGQVGFFTNENNCESWDYNCDETMTGEHGPIGYCGGDWFCKDNMVEGWLNNNPECGEVAAYITDCKWNASGCEATTKQRTQGCR